MIGNKNTTFVMGNNMPQQTDINVLKQACVLNRTNNFIREVLSGAAHNYIYLSMLDLLMHNTLVD